MWICACIEEHIHASWIKLDFLKTKNSCNGCQLLPWWWGCGIALAKPDRCGSQTGAAILQLVRPPGSQASPEQTDPLVAPTGFLAWQVEDRRCHCSTTEFFFLQLCSIWTVRSKSGHTTYLNMSQVELKVSPSLEDPSPGFQNHLGTVLWHVSCPTIDLTVAICTAGDKDKYLLPFVLPIIYNEMKNVWHFNLNIL